MSSRFLWLAQFTFLLACVISTKGVAQEVAGPALLGSGDPAWLSYKPVASAMVFPGGIPDTVVELGHGVLEDSAAKELGLGWRGLLQSEPRLVRGASDGGQRAVVLGTEAEVNAWRPHVASSPALKHDAYRLYVDKNALVIEGGDDRGVLYGLVRSESMAARSGPHGGDGDWLHRAIPCSARCDLRVTCYLPGRSFAVYASCAVHLSTALWLDRDADD